MFSDSRLDVVVVKREDRPSAGGSGGGILLIDTAQETLGIGRVGLCLPRHKCERVVAPSRCRFGVWTLFRWSEGMPRLSGGRCYWLLETLG